MSTFQRARTPEQRDERREHILVVARKLLTERRVAEVGLNELARHVGLAKSNVLRYFESREAVLLELTKREYTAWVDTMVSRAPDGPKELAEVMAATAVARPLLAELLSSVMTTLEHNVTTETIIDFKLAMYEQLGRLQGLLDSVIGELGEPERSAIIPGLHALIVEFHALAHPSTALKQAAVQDPRIHCGLDDHEQALSSALNLYLNGARVAS